MPKASPPTPARKCRRLSLTMSMPLGTSFICFHHSGSERATRLMDCRADTYVGRAAAYVAAHGSIDVGIARVRIGFQQRSGRHDLPGLAVAALHDVQLL